MSHQGTVVERKQQFLQSRKQLLSRGIVPSEKLKRVAVEGGIELTVLKGALDKVNRELKQHSRRVYSRQMTEHVVEQIDTFYWASGAQDIESDPTDTSNDAADGAHTVFQSDDLTQDDVISKLPIRWDTSADPPPSSQDAGEEPVDQDDYLSAVTRLQSLSARRMTLQNKLNGYKALLELLAPYGQPKENIQPNLVWRDGPLAAELAKTRTLAIRVAGRVEERFGDVEVPATATAEEDGDVDMEDDNGRKKVDKILESW